MDTPRPETASPTELIVRDQPTSLVPNDLSDDFNAKFELIREALRKEAQKRRKKKTPASEKIKRPIGDGKEVEAVQRPSYQRWLDENFPGWYVENAHFWKDSAEDGKPVLYNCQLTLCVRDTGGVLRKTSGVGSAPVSLKEVERGNTQLLKFKYEMAQTAAMKSAANWLGAFFDLRDDEEERERRATPTTPEQNDQYSKLRKDIPEVAREKVDEQWKSQNFYSAPAYLKALSEKIEKTKENKPNA